ncbi:MAG: SprT-like domain-containing protein [Muribaculaceae bacterium]|nr:SprT-like domain-containing protein [Muribaculaceae bacterium]
MTPTREIVAEKFSKFNNLCFGGQLPPIKVRMSNAKSFLGQLRYKTQRHSGGTNTHYDYEMTISTCYDVELRELEDTIIHEMIHYYILINGIEDESSHGPVFRRIMKEINERYGRNVRLSQHRGSMQMKAGNMKRFSVLCVSTLPDGRRGVTVCARTRIFHIYDMLPRCYGVKQMEWYLSDDTFFNRFPNSVTPKIYVVSADELATHLKTARPLECDGNSIKIKR